MKNIRSYKRLLCLCIAVAIMFTVFPITSFSHDSEVLSPDTDNKEGDRSEDITASENKEDEAISNTVEYTAEKDGISESVLYSESEDTSILENGVYAISKNNTTSYFHCNTVNGGTYVPQGIFSSPPLSEATRHAIFKIIYRAYTDDYIIRSMVNNEVIIYANVGYNSPLSIKMHNTNDASIPVDKAWKIIEVSSGVYTISCDINGTTYYMSMPASGNLQLTTNGNSDEAKWNFHKYTGETFRGWGMIGEWPEHIENGSSATIEAYIYSTVIRENSAWFRKSSVDPEVATVTQSTSDMTRMTITPKYGGNTKIQIEANTGSAIFGYHYLMSGWDIGSFFIKNKHSSEYLTQTGGISESYLSLTGLPNGTDKEYTLWNMMYWSQGYYKIVQDFVGDCMYGDSPVSSDLEGKPYANEAYQKNLWKFIPQPDGSFKIQSYYHERNNPNHYVSLDNVVTRNVRSLANTGNKQLWYIEPLRFNINVLFDQAFIDRHSGIGYLDVLNDIFGENPEGKTIESNMLDRLGYHATVSYVSKMYDPYLSYPYLKNCNLLEGSDIYHKCNNSNSSEPFNCDNSTTTDQLSDCHAGYHHKNVNWILDEISSSERIVSTNARLLFSGLDCCSISYGVHATSYGRAWSAKTKCLVLSTSSNIRRTTQHELSHILGSIDCGGDDNGDCITGDGQTEDPIINNMVLCNDCLITMKLLKYTFYNH